MNPKYGTKTNHSSAASHLSLTPSERFTSHQNTSTNASINTDLTNTLSQPHLDSGISMSMNSSDKREQISLDKPSTSFTVSNILIGNEGKDEIDGLKHVTVPTTMILNQTRTLSHQAKTNLPIIPVSNILPYPVSQQSTSILHIC